MLGRGRDALRRAGTRILQHQSTHTSCQPFPPHVSTHAAYQAEIPEQAAMRIGGVDGFVPYRAAATLLATALSPPPSIGGWRIACGLAAHWC